MLKSIVNLLKLNDYIGRKKKGISPLFNTRDSPNLEWLTVRKSITSSLILDTMCGHYSMTIQTMSSLIIPAFKIHSHHQMNTCYNWLPWEMTIKAKLLTMSMIREEWMCSILQGLSISTPSQMGITDLSFSSQLNKKGMDISRHHNHLSQTLRNCTWIMMSKILYKFKSWWM